MTGGRLSPPLSTAEATPLDDPRRPLPSPPSSSAPPASTLDGFEILVETRRPPSLPRRFFTTHRHLAGLAAGGLLAYVRERPAARRKGLLFRLARLAAFLVRPLVAGSLRELPFPVQLRRRLELLGPTYIKLGQILSLREDLLPRSITDELKNLLDRLPVLPFPRYAERVAADLGRPLDAMFTWVDPRPLGSASIAQIHRATTLAGEQVILKVVKPGIRETLTRDARLLRLFGSLLQMFLARYRPKQLIREFTDYTLREVDLGREADNAETFAANFKDLPGVVFPRIYRELSSRNVLTMEFLDGVKPSSEEAQALPEEDRDRLVDLGAAAIIRMIYQDGFFHADLHPGNLLILPGPRAGFIDLGMVGRFDDDLRRTLLYYYYCLVMGDTENAARYLASVAEPGAGARPDDFRREVAEICRRWHRRASFEGFSLARLVMQSVNMGAQFRLYFPVEMVLMVKALVTYEGVGQILKPGLDVAEVSRNHIGRIFLHQFSPLRLAREGLRGAPEILDAVIKAPMLIIEGLRFLEQTTRRPRENPLAGVRGTLFGGFCLVAGAILLAFKPHLWPIWSLLFLFGVLVPLRRGR